jgi:predicted transcriptional regulator
MLTISVDGQLETRLKRAAAATGADPETVARQVLETNLPADNSATLALLDRWDAEDAVVAPAERERDRQETEELMRNLDRNRTDAEGPSARRLWP